MKIFVLICNIIVPLIMIFIGILHAKHSNKKLNKILDFFIPISSILSGLDSPYNNDFSKNKNLIEYNNKKCSIIWFISGFFTLVITSIVLILNRSSILNTTNFLDTNNASIIMLEVEFSIAIIVYIIVLFILKKDFYKKNNTKF